MYDHGSQEEITQKAQQEAEQVLRQLCKDTQKDIRADTPRLFSSLVAALRRVDSSGLQALLSSLEQNTLCAANTRPKWVTFYVFNIYIKKLLIDFDAILHNGVEWWKDGSFRYAAKLVRGQGHRDKKKSEKDEFQSQSR